MPPGPHKLIVRKFLHMRRSGLTLMQSRCVAETRSRAQRKGLAQMATVRTTLPKPCCCNGRWCLGIVQQRPFIEFAIHVDGGCERVYAATVRCLTKFIKSADREQMAGAINTARTARAEDYRAAARSKQRSSRRTNAKTTTNTQ